MDSKRLLRGLVIGLAAILAQAAPAEHGEPQVMECLDVGPVWSGHAVGFCLLTCPQGQYVACYDPDRRMTVARRAPGSDAWEVQTLPSTIGWDSHNYVTMALDEIGHLHVSGNMHVHPLVYFRTERPGDIRTLRAVPAMVGDLERRCTYPRFFAGPQGELIFTYRDGSSGSGNQIYSTYDARARTWRRLLDEPLLDGRGAMNAYPVGPDRGPDGRFHLCWIWRDTPDCNTNHDVSYARSRDLVHWETAAGEPVELPMTVETPGLIVDAVPPGGGAINGNTRIGFDAQGRPIVTYHKFDERGLTQVYNARYEDGRWRIYRTSDWDYRWSFEGGGTIHFEVRVSPVKVGADGILTQRYSHDKHGSGTWKLDAADLRPIGQVQTPRQWPASLARPESHFPGMQVNWRPDAGTSVEPGTRYVLRWESLGVHRDRPRDVAPPPSMLRLYRLRDP